MLNRRQVDVQYQNLATMCRMTVKSLIDYACVNTHVDEDCEEFVNFCAVFEQMVAHRIRPYQKRVWHRGQGSPRHFWEVMLDNHRQGPLFRSCIPNIEAIESIKSPKAKLRAFVRVALMEKRLSDYLQWLQNNRSLMDESYLDGALFTSEEGLELCGDIIGLSAIDFNFCLRGNENDLLGPLEINYVPFLNYVQSPASRLIDEEEMLQLSGKMAPQEDPDIPQHFNDDKIRLQALERDFRGVKEQKDYLEELIRLRERQTGEANLRVEAMRVSALAKEKEWEGERRMLDACVLELQEEISAMRNQSNLLKAQVSELQAFKMRLEYRDVQMVDLAGLPVPSSPEDQGEDNHEGEAEGTDIRPKVKRNLSKTLNSLKHWLRTKHASIVEGLSQALPMVSMKDSSTTQMSADQKSILSGISDQIRLKEDTQSLVPLTGSLADVNIAMIRDNQQLNEETAGGGDWKRAETGSVSSQGKAKDRDGFVNVELTLFQSDDRDVTIQTSSNNDNNNIAAIPDLTATEEMSPQPPSSATTIEKSSTSELSAAVSNTTATITTITTTTTPLLPSSSQTAKTMGDEKNFGGLINIDESYVVTGDDERDDGERREERDVTVQYKDCATSIMMTRGEEQPPGMMNDESEREGETVVEKEQQRQQNVSSASATVHDDDDDDDVNNSGSAISHALQDLEKAFDTETAADEYDNDGDNENDKATVASHSSDNIRVTQSPDDSCSRDGESGGESGSGDNSNSNSKEEDAGNTSVSSTSEPEMVDKANTSSEGSDATWELLSDPDESDK